ncbi:MAG: hypothetical protein COB27_004715 [Moritella sp.]|uniref:hypothetical protein n=1 Tax=Moritella sp. TaxID=78556 RepID=UPI00216EE3E5|nr:hypothetical protein [Moritella sp.]MBL1416161.1 hypothetical protein [Moritella sp.]
MAYIDVVTGDVENTQFTIDGDNLTNGLFNVQTIPINEIVSLMKKEVIKKELYIDFVLSGGKKFTATMNEKTYRKLYKIFISKGNKPTGIDVPIKSKSKSNVIWTCAGLILLALFMVRGISSNGNKSQSAQIFDKATATAICDINIENVAIYGAKISGFSDIQFYKYDNGSGYRLVRNFKLGNAYGGFAKSKASCRFSNSGVLTGLNVDGEKVI